MTRAFFIQRQDAKAAKKNHFFLYPEIKRSEGFRP